MMSVIATIHQPNNQLFQKFDSIYVLAKGGIHIYSGKPQDLEQHLIDSNIANAQLQYPIEDILRIGSNISNQDLIQLSKINSEAKDYVFSREEEILMSGNGLKQKTKRFSPKDFWYLLVRNMICCYVYEWKSLLTQIILYLLLGISLSILYKREISLIDGCVDKNQFMTTFSCNDTEDSLHEVSQLKQNIQSTYFSMNTQIVSKAQINKHRANF